MQYDRSYAIEPYQETAAIARPELTPGKWQMILNIAEVIHKSRKMYSKGVTTPEAAALILLKGFELGIGITASLELITEIQGKIELIPRGALALLHQSPYIKHVSIEHFDLNGKAIEMGSAYDRTQYGGCRCTIERANGFKFTAQFTLIDAQRAGLLKPDSGWSKYPENMCQWRAIGFAADAAAPDVTAGMTALLKAPEMYGVSIDDEGDIIDVTPPAAPPTEQAPPSVQTQAVMDIGELMDRYPVAEILNANGGRIPATAEEITKVVEALA